MGLLEEAKDKVTQALLAGIGDGPEQEVEVLYDEAEQVFKQALEIEGPGLEVCLHYGRLLMQRGRPEEARRQYDQAQQFDPDNEALNKAYQELERLHPQSEVEFDLLEEDGGGDEVAFSSPEPEIAPSDLLDSPTTPAWVGEESSRTVVKVVVVPEISATEADEYWALGDYRKDEEGNLTGAEIAYQTALEYDAYHRRTLQAYSLLLLEQARYTEAEEYLTRLAEVDPAAIENCFAELAADVQPELLALQARLHLGQNATMEAESLLRQALKAEPDRVDWMVDYVKLLNELERPEEAIGYLRAAFARQPEAAPLHREYARLMAVRGQYDEVETHLKQAEALTPDDPDTLELRDELKDKLAAYEKALRQMALARTRIKQGLFDEARKQFKLALETDPEHLPALKAYAAFLEQQQDFEEAEQIWNRVALKAPAEAETYFQTLLQIRGDNSETLNSLARVLIQLDRLSEAKTHLRRSLSLEPDNFETLQLLVDLLYEQEQLQAVEQLLQDNLAILADHAKLSLRYAQLLAIRRNYAEAKKYFEQAQALDPFDEEIEQACLAEAEQIKRAEQAELEMATGWMEARSGNYDQAEQAYLQALEIDPEHVVTLSRYANLLEELGQAAKAGEYLRRLAEIDPTAAEAHYRSRLTQLTDRPESLAAYAQLLQSLDRPQEAQEQLRTVLAQHPAYLPALEPYLALLLKDGQVKEAEESLKLALSQADSVAEIHWHYANLLAEHRHRYELARIHFEQAIDLSDKPEYRAALDQIRPELDKIGEAELEWAYAQELAETSPLQAEPVFMKAYECCPDFVPNLIDYGRFLWQQKRPEEARRYLEEALQIDPYAEEAAQYLNELEKLVIEEISPPEAETDQVTEESFEEEKPNDGQTDAE